jgi:hypothetical protein
LNFAPQTGQKSPLKNPFLYSSLLVLFVALYVGYILLSRHESLLLLEKRSAAQQAEKRHEDDVQAIDQLGGSDLSIRSLYLSPPAVHPGDAAQLCYDVANAKTVALDPPVAEVWPSHSRCIDLAAKRTTTYTLTVSDAAGKTLSQSVELKVR